ncbi:Methionine aminopeptidase [Nymphon striatum]|nr:Methionine aminopeptidase [Nymphon striatum]
MKFSSLATKSVSQLTSTIEPSFPSSETVITTLPFTIIKKTAYSAFTSINLIYLKVFMAIQIKTPEQIEKMRVAGRLASEVLDMIGPHVVPGITTNELDKICHDYIVNEQQAIPAPLNYHGFPKSICTSVNYQVCHGIPSDKKLKKGDIINIDITVIKDGFHGDTSKMFYVGKPNVATVRLCEVAQKALYIWNRHESGYKSPTELQTQLIPLVAERKSALIWSQSASGKTGAFLIPAMNYILENPAPEKRGARVLILTSRRDRVSQINYTIKRLSSDLVMRFGFIVSGRPYQTQMRLMRRPLDIMIATPGRLNDLMNNGKADFSQLEMLIIDDLSSIYKKNLQGLVESILNQAGPDCSSITFITVNEEDEEDGPVETNQHQQENNASTQPKKPQQQAKGEQSPKNNNNHKTVDIKTLMPQKVHIADDYTHKIAMMDHLMDEFAGESTLIYTATTKAAKTLQDNLTNHGHTAELIHELNAEEPFVNLSKAKPNNRSNQKRSNQQKKNPNARKNDNAKNAKNKNARRTKPGGRAKQNNNNKQQKAADGTSRRQHKGAFGRLNGGTHRKNNGKKIGVSRVGTDAPKDGGGRSWQSDFAEPKERSADKGKPVAIRYSKKRSLSIKKPEEVKPSE